MKFENLPRPGRCARAVFLAVLLAFGAAVLFAPLAHARTYVRMTTVMGDIDVELFDNITPLTVANFLTYVDNTDYDYTFIHRSADIVIPPDIVIKFVIQGGGYKCTIPVAENAPVVNEFNLSNKRGTIAMAKVDGDPDSATNQWFFNLSDNSANLDYQNDGFTVFGRVIGDGMEVVDAIAALDTWYLDPNFTNVPLIDYTGGTVTCGHLVTIPRISRIYGPVTLADIAAHWLDSGCDDSARDETDWCYGCDLGQDDGLVNLKDYSIFASTWPQEDPGPYEGNFDFDGDVDMVDFAVFAAAWSTSNGDAGYNRACDLYFDGSVDEHDLAVFAENWLSIAE